MKDYIKVDEWKIIEQGFDPHNNKVSESIFSLGNGRMGQRANFEEAYSGDTLLGNYVAGVYYNKLVLLLIISCATYFFGLFQNQF